jgi:RsiW-degrading membrane proteinase PrsW (M82 family)
VNVAEVTPEGIIKRAKRCLQWPTVVVCTVWQLASFVHDWGLNAVIAGAVGWIPALAVVLVIMVRSRREVLTLRCWALLAGVTAANVAGLFEDLVPSRDWVTGHFELMLLVGVVEEGSCVGALALIGASQARRMCIEDWLGYATMVGVGFACTESSVPGPSWTGELFRGVALPVLHVAFVSMTAVGIWVAARSSRGAVVRGGIVATGWLVAVVGHALNDYRAFRANGSVIAGHLVSLGPHDVGIAGEMVAAMLLWVGLAGAIELLSARRTAKLIARVWVQLRPMGAISGVTFGDTPEWRRLLDRGAIRSARGDGPRVLAALLEAQEVMVRLARNHESSRRNELGRELIAALVELDRAAQVAAWSSVLRLLADSGVVPRSRAEIWMTWPESRIGPLHLGGSPDLPVGGVSG